LIGSVVTTSPATSHPDLAPPDALPELHPDEAPVAGEDELVTVLIPVRNEERSIERCLESVLRQDYPNLQVLVVDGASDDGTAKAVLKFAQDDPRVELLENPRPTIPRSLNVGLAASRGKWLIRVDAHSTVPPSYVRTLVGHLRSGRWGGVGGRKDGVGLTPAGRAIAAALASRFGVGGSLYHYARRSQPVDHVPFGAYPTELLRELGGWNERLEANEDFELDYRIRRSGQVLLLDPSVAIAWLCQQSIGDLFRQYRRYGRGKARVTSLHPASLSPRHVGPPALIAAWSVALPLGIRWPWVPAVAVLPYLISLAAAAVVTGRRVEGRGAIAMVAASFAAMHIGWGLGFWQGIGGLVAGLFRRPRRG
jgi:succinoglycan biosynthesis protein ExoA